MLQIIGLIGCFYLIVKAMEMLCSRDHRDENGTLTGGTIATVIITVIGAFLFVTMLFQQGAAMAPVEEPAGPTAYSMCLDAADTADEIHDCTKLI